MENKESPTIGAFDSEAEKGHPVSVPIGEAGDEESPTIGAFDSEAEKRQLAVYGKSTVQNRFTLK